MQRSVFVALVLSLLLAGETSFFITAVQCFIETSVIEMLYCYFCVSVLWRVLRCRALWVSHAHLHVRDHNVGGRGSGGLDKGDP